VAQITETGKLECRSAKSGEPIEIDPGSIEDLIPYNDGISRSTVVKRADPDEPLIGVNESPAELILLLTKAAEAAALLIIERLIARAMR